MSDKWYNQTIPLRDDLYKEYIKEKKLETKPPYLFSFYTFLAYKNIWKLIVRYNLSEKEIEIMKELNCYKTPRREIS
jgi:hypothetical protein